MPRYDEQGAGRAHPILVVDDEPAVRRLFVRALQAAGHATHEAADGVEALAFLERNPVALILLDSTMPRLEGAAVIRAIRERDATRTLPVVLVTANANLEDRVRGLEAGADDYLAKPVVLGELVARVHAQLRSHAAWTEAFEREAEGRRRVTAALRRVRLDGSPESRSRSLAEELMAALELDALAVVAFTPDERAVPLAVEGGWAELGRPGIALEQRLAQTLRTRSAEGPWVQRLAASSQGGNSEIGREVASLPLAGRDAPLGLVFFGLSPRGQRGGLAQRMPILVEVADAIAMLLRPTLEADNFRLRAHASLEAIIDRQEFTPHFQAVVSLADGAVVGYEALTRFADGTAPDIRFAEAERLGLGSDLELATLRAAALAATSLPSGTFLALNVSPSLVLGATDLGAVLGAGGRERELVLELTEHAPVADYAALRAALERVDPPARVAVDDAGSGYSSLRHVLALRPAYVKLDVSLIRGIEADPARQALVAGLVHFAAEVGCHLIGEGIETEAERRTLYRLGVPLGQGHLLGGPLPAAHIHGRAHGSGGPSPAVRRAEEPPTGSRRPRPRLGSAVEARTAPAPWYG